MAITASQLNQATAAIEDVEAKHARWLEAQAAAVIYADGGELSQDLADLLRSWLAPQIQARIENYKTNNIDAQVTQIRTYISDYALPAV